MEVDITQEPFYIRFNIKDNRISYDISQRSHPLYNLISTALYYLSINYATFNELSTIIKKYIKTIMHTLGNIRY